MSGSPGELGHPYLQLEVSLVYATLRLKSQEVSVSECEPGVCPSRTGDDPGLARALQRKSSSHCPSPGGGIRGLRINYGLRALLPGW